MVDDLIIILSFNLFDMDLRKIGLAIILVRKKKFKNKYLNKKKK